MEIFFDKTKDLAIYTGINFWASDPDNEFFRPIHHLPIYTDTDSNRFLGLLTLPIPILRYEYHTDTDTDFLKNTDIPIPIIPIIGLALLLHAKEVPTIWLEFEFYQWWNSLFMPVILT